MSSAYSISASILSPHIDEADNIDQLNKAPPPSRKLVNLGKNSEPGQGQGAHSLTKKNLNLHEESGSPPGKESSGVIKYDLCENPFAGAKERSSAGKISWYYDETRVCERCYGIYRELDALRYSLTG